MHARHDGRLVFRQLAVFGQRLVGFPDDVNHDTHAAEEHDKARAKHKAQESQHANNTPRSVRIAGPFATVPEDDKRSRPLFGWPESPAPSPAKRPFRVVLGLTIPVIAPASVWLLTCPSRAATSAERRVCDHSRTLRLMRRDPMRCSGGSTAKIGRTDILSDRQCAGRGNSCQSPAPGHSPLSCATSPTTGDARPACLRCSPARAGSMGCQAP